MLNRLQAGAGTYACGGYLAGLGSLQRSEICTALLFSRLERKMRMVDALREEASENWNQTFYLLYFRTLGDRRNQEAYLSLARRVPYKVVLRERLAPRAVEAMFFGASGLLTLYPHDAYTLDLARDFEYLAAKYDIEPLDAGVWELDEDTPRQPSRTASGTGGGVLHTGRIRNGTRHVMPHGRGYPAAVLHRSVGLLAHAPHPGDRKRRTPQAFGSIQGQYHRHQPRFRPAIRLRQRHRARNAARQRPHAARTPASRGQPLHAQLAQHGRYRSATRSNRRRCCNSPRNTVLQNAVRNAPSDGASCKA